MQYLIIKQQVLGSYYYFIITLYLLLLLLKVRIIGTSTKIRLYILSSYDLIISWFHKKLGARDSLERDKRIISEFSLVQRQ